MVYEFLLLNFTWEDQLESRPETSNYSLETKCNIVFYFWQVLDGFFIDHLVLFHLADLFQVYFVYL